MKLWGKKNPNTGGKGLEIPPYVKVDAVIDVGVAAGTNWLWDRFEDSDLILIDPIDMTSQIKTKRNFVFHKVALASKPGKAKIRKYIDRPALSGFYKRAITHKTISYGEVVEEEVEVVRLDELIKPSKSTNSYLLKIDAEGSELEIFKGAQGLYSKTEWIISEVSCRKLYEDSYSFSELICEFSNAGYEVHSILRVAGEDGIWIADILFKKKVCRDEF
jgi:FkbM family methyltransferase